MPAFCTYKSAKRLPAKAFEPVTDPAGWDPDELRDVDRWSYYLTPQDNQEILDAVAMVRRKGIPVEQVSKENFKLEKLANLLEDVRMELRNDPVPHRGVTSHH